MIWIEAPRVIALVKGKILTKRLVMHFIRNPMGKMVDPAHPENAIAFGFPKKWPRPANIWIIWPRGTEDLALRAANGSRPIRVNGLAAVSALTGLFSILHSAYYRLGVGGSR